MRFSPLFAVGLAMAVAVVAGQVGSAQAGEGSEGNGDDLAARIAQRNILWPQALQLEAQGQYVEAAELYKEVVALTPMSLRSADAGMRAARCLERLGRFAEAIDCYDLAVVPADARADQEPGTQGLRDWKCEALFFKAQACAHAGRGSEVLPIARQLREEFPDSVRASEIAILEAQVQGGNPQPAEALFVRDTQAMAIVRQAVVNAAMAPAVRLINAAWMTSA